MRAKWNVKGTEEMRGLATRLDSLAQQALTGFGESPELKNILEDAAVPVLKMMRLNVVTRARTHTGGLEAGIGYKLGSGLGYAYLAFGWLSVPGKRKRGSRARVAPAKVSQYGPILEFSEKRQVRHMYDAFDETADEAAQIIKAGLDALLKRLLAA